MFVTYFYSKWVCLAQAFAKISVRLEIMHQTSPTVCGKLIYTTEVLPYRTM